MACKDLSKKITAYKYNIYPNGDFFETKTPPPPQLTNMPEHKTLLYVLVS
jgi:hypothetical protein